MIPIYIAAQVSAMANQIAARQAQERQKLGLPPLPPTPLPMEIEKDRTGEFLMISWIILGGIIFCAPWAMMIYCVVKFMFAKQGIKWP